jgi:hypothetical protein
MTVHSLPTAGSTEERSTSETRKGRWTLLWLFVFSAFPVIASYFTYYVVRPDGRRNYGELIEPMRTLPAWHGTDVGGNEVALDSLMHQWLLVSVAADGVEAVLAMFREAGFGEAAVFGTLAAGAPRITVV